MFLLYFYCRKFLYTLNFKRMYFQDRGCTTKNVKKQFFNIYLKTVCVNLKRNKPCTFINFNVIRDKNILG